MPFINDRLADTASQPLSSRPGGAPGGTGTASRFRYEPAAVMQKLQRRIIGQQPMKRAVEDMLHLVKADLGLPHRPLAVMLFLGPTGVGKTETVRVVAEAIHGDSEHFCRIDMNTLSQQHYAAALSGAPPGYVGSKEGHTLFDDGLLRGTFGKPGIVLFDEVEKADRDVARTLLNVLDNGRISLAGGRDVLDFRNTLIFMTSNVGAAEVAALRRQGEGRLFRRPLSPEREKALMIDALHRHFDPEFVNRLDSTIVFDHLDHRDLDLLIELELERLCTRLAGRGVTVELTPGVRRLIKNDYDETFGARDMARCFRNRVTVPVARQLSGQVGPARFLLVLEGSEPRAILQS